MKTFLLAQSTPSLSFKERGQGMSFLKCRYSHAKTFLLAQSTPSLSFKERGQGVSFLISGFQIIKMDYAT
jgi:hypothetical protein